MISETVRMRDSSVRLKDRIKPRSLRTRSNIGVHGSTNVSYLHLYRTLSNIGVHGSTNVSYLYLTE